MLEHTRAVTLQEINDLSVEQLDSIMSSGGNSIGALLKHIAAIEKLTNLFHFKNVTLQRRIRNMGRRTLFRESGRTIRGHEIQYYVQLLQKFEKNL